VKVEKANVANLSGSFSRKSCGRIVTGPVKYNIYIYIYIYIYITGCHLAGADPSKPAPAAAEVAKPAAAAASVSDYI
jgi:hypothetical protein